MLNTVIAKHALGSMLCAGLGLWLYLRGEWPATLLAMVALALAVVLGRSAAAAWGLRRCVDLSGMGLRDEVKR